MLSYVLITIVLVSVGWLGRRLARPSRLPPGPKGFPLLGNALQVPRELQFLKFSEWAQELGDIYTVDLLGKKLVVLSSAKAAADVLDRMSVVTSGRPRFVMSGEIMTNGLVISFMQYDDRWRRLRRVIHESFNIRACEAYYPFQDSEAAKLVLSLLKHPQDMENHLHRVAASTIWRSLYSGQSFTTEDEKKVKTISHTVEALLKAATPFAYIVDTLPILKAVPGWMVAWKLYGEDFYRDADSFYRRVFEEGKLQQKGTGNKGFISSSVTSLTRSEITYQEAAWTAGSLFGAAVDTTAAALLHFMLAMILYPDVAKAAQREIDSVVGPHLPTLTDRSELPYMQAMVKELHRWRPVAPLGFPHVATEELEYRGFVFPKGTTFFSNVWAITHDPAVFPDHNDFRPERYLKSDGSLKDPIPDYHDDIVSYGYGRRICTGRDFANNSLFIDMTYLLWAFEITAATDQDGRQINPDPLAFVDCGVTVRPAPFKYELRPRRPNLGEILISSD